MLRIFELSIVFSEY